MARSILFSIMFITGALGVVIFSAAQFTDADDTTSNVVRAGTIELNMTPVGDIDCPVPIYGLEGAPSTPAGDSQTVCSFSLIHDGTLPNADLYAQIEITPRACRAIMSDPGWNSQGWDSGFDSLYCDTGADLSDAQFRVIDTSLGWDGQSAPSPGWPVHLDGTNPILFSQFIDANHPAPGSTGNTLRACTRIVEGMPVNEEVNGSITLELDQTLTRNVMQGDAIEITIWFELAERGATGVDCRFDDPETGESPAPGDDD